MLQQHFVFQTDDYEVDGTKVKAVLEVIKLNKPEWMEIVVGCMASVLTGAALPVYSLVFGDVVGVCRLILKRFRCQTIIFRYCPRQTTKSSEAKQAYTAYISWQLE